MSAADRPAVGTALASLRERWGTAAPRRGEEAFGGTVGALATVPLPQESESEAPRAPMLARTPTPARAPMPGPAPAIPIVSTGFPGLDAVLGPGGIPRTASVTLRGDATSGRTTLALRLVAEAQAAGSIAAWLDLTRSLDPVEAMARGIRLEWLAVLAPIDLDEGLVMAGTLLQARAVDLLVVDLPRRAAGGRVAERLARLGVLARRAGILLVVLEPPGIASSTTDPIGAGLRLELARQGWVRLGREIVGQLTRVVVARNRHGPPGGRAVLRILYAEGGPRDTCLRSDPLLAGWPPGPVADPSGPARVIASPGIPIEPFTSLPIPVGSDAPPPSSLAQSPHPPRHGPSGRGAVPPFRVLPGRADRAGRPPLGRRGGPRCRPGRPGPRRPAGDGPRRGAPAGSRGDLPRPRS